MPDSLEKATKRDQGARRSAGWWLLVLVVYTAGTLAWLGSRCPGELPGRVVSSEGGRVSAVPVLGQAAGLVAGSVSRDRAQSLFSIPLPVDELDGIEQYRLVLYSATRLAGCVVQVIVECDHHFSYSHVYHNVELSSAGFAIEAPLIGAGAAGYWSPVAHSGVWTAWERGGLRKLEVKVFGESLPRGGLELRHESVVAESTGAVRLAWSNVLADPVSLGTRFELAFDLAGWQGNPFDYSVLPVTLEVTAPGCAPRRVEPFLYQNFETVAGLDRERIRPCGPKHFLVRYRPAVEGRHAYRLLGREAGGLRRELGAGFFEVSAGEAPDFLRVSGRSPRYFEHADGRFFYPIGWNIPYPVDRPYGQDYVPYLPDEKSLVFTQKLLDDLADAGGNFVRFWLSDWWNGLEWNRNVDNYGGMGRYNLKNAWLNDRVLEQCERRKIYLQLETINHVSLRSDYGWPAHPYNVANGGFLQDLYAFWQAPRNLELSRNRMNYLVARYADSPAIHSWHVMSEPDILGRQHWPNAKEYILSQLRVIQELDGYGHLTGNQMCMSDRDPSFFLSKEISFVSANAYAGGIASMPEDQIPTIRMFSERYGGQGRPMMVAESVGHYAGDPAFKMRRDTLGMLWSGVVSGLAGTPLSWWWNFNYGEDLGVLYRVVGDFMTGEDLAAADSEEQGWWLNREVVCTNGQGNLRGLMAGNAVRRFLFVYNFDTLGRTRGLASSCTGNRVTFGGLEAGEYVAEYWDLRSGRTGVVQELRVAGDGAAELAPPDFTEGWAVKIHARAGAGVGDSVVQPVAGPDPAAPGLASDSNGQAGAVGEWSWRLLPRVGVVYEGAAGRAVLEARIGLPVSCRSCCPGVFDEAGKPVPFAWERLGAGAGWRIVVRAEQARPLTVLAVDGLSVEPAAIDEESSGLLVMVGTGSFGNLATAEEFEGRFRSLPDKRQARMSVIDQVENPLGTNQGFLAVYSGPLLAPVDGDYVFASNSDDGSFVKVDGKVVVAAPASHNMDEENRPAANTWARRGVVKLKRGLHWLEYEHQQNGGACLARLGWQPPSGWWAGESVMAQPFVDGSAAGAIETVPAWALDGRIPCAVEIRQGGAVQATLAPCLGLELRRPGRSIPVLALEDGGKAPRYEFLGGVGLQWFRVGAKSIPVWGWNVASRRFSMEWERCVGGTNQPFLKTLTYDIAVPLSLKIGGRSAGEQAHSMRQWVAWPLKDSDRHAEFTVSLGGVPLLSGPVGFWPGVEGVTSLAICKPAGLERLKEVSLVRTGGSLPGARLAAWWKGPPPSTVAVDFMRMDPWQVDPASLVKALGAEAGGTGLLIRLDRPAILMGLTNDEVYGRLRELVRAVGESGAVPVLVLDSGFEIDLPAAQAMAIAFHRVAVEAGCPFVDLRKLTL